MSHYERIANSTETPRVKKPSAQGKSKVWTSHLLSTVQKTKLSIAARSAWEIQSNSGLVDGKFDDWRYTETEIACGVRSFREARNSDYLSILAHFLRLAGKTAEAEAAWAKTGRVTGSTEQHDTHENREVARAILRDLVAKSNGKLSDSYVLAIATRKHPGATLDTLTARQLQQLVFTLKARLRRK